MEPSSKGVWEIRGCEVGAGHARVVCAEQADGEDRLQSAFRGGGDGTGHHLHLELFQQALPAYTKKELRDDIVRECKALRHKTEKKESELFKPAFLAEVMNVLWDR